MWPFRFRTKTPPLPQLVHAGRWTCLLLILHSVLLINQGFGDSATWDEVGHLAAGVRHCRDGNFTSYKVNPPLVRLAATVVLAELAPETDAISTKSSSAPQIREEFIFGREFAQASGAKYFWYMAIARAMCIPFSLLGAWICSRWANELYGSRAGIFALTLWVFSPNILAYGHLITPDAGAASIGLWAAYRFRHWLSKPSFARSISAGFVLGLALLTKTTWIILFITWPIIWCIQMFFFSTTGGPSGRVRCGQIMLLLCLGLWVLNIGYGFEGFFTPLRQYRFLSSTLRSPSMNAFPATEMNRFTRSWAGGIPVPLPENYVLGIDYVKWEYEQKYWSYLRGEWRHGGWWYYYIYAALVKTPLGTLLLLALATAVVTCRIKGYSSPATDELLLLLPPIVLFVLVSSQTGFNHHLRYVLPSLPFLFVWISRLARSFELGHRCVSMAVIFGSVWSVVSSLSVLPHSLSYFNELAEGPKNGHWHLGNSNADWGQDLLYLKKWYDRHLEARPLHVGYDLGLIDPRLAGIEWQPLPIGPTASQDILPREDPLGPQPGWHAISVNWLHERHRRYDYFNDLTPVDWIGYTMPIYHITLEDANRLRRKYGMQELEQ